MRRSFLDVHNMRFHIWCPRISESAAALRDLFKYYNYSAFKSFADIESNPRRLNRFLKRVRSGDIWINWGSPYNFGDYRQKYVPQGLTLLNQAPFLNKKSQLLTLASKNIPTLTVSNTPKEGFIGRSLNHQGGDDLLNKYGRDFYTKKEAFSREVRIHIYKGKSIHAGLKVPTPEAHPWIRSYDAGWRIDYSRATDIAQSRRELAKKAISALGLDFGAVDIGVLQGDKALVIEVNTAPGIEGETLQAYVTQFLSEAR